MKTQLTAVLFTSLLLTQASFAQTKREILEEDPKQSPNLRLELTALNLTSTSRDEDARVEFGARVSYRHNNRFAVSGEYQRSMDNLADDGSYYHSYKKPGHTFEGVVTYFFANKEKEVDEWMPVKSEAVGYRTVQVTVDPVPMTRLALYGVRGGMGSINSTANNPSATLVNVNNPAQVLEEKYATPMLKTSYAFAGVSASRIKNTKVKYPVYGTRRKQYIREYFMDFIYPVSNQFSTVEENEGNVKSIYRLDPSAEANKLAKYGARIGFFSTPTGRMINVGYGFEVGSMPRAYNFSEGIYWNFRLAISLMKNLNPKD